MTQEEKAKAYDEAIKMTKEFLMSPRTCFDIEQLYDIFPELQESEDKKIMKGIKSILEHYKECGVSVCPYPFVSIDEALTWLEKQGEQKPKRMISSEAKEALYDKPAWSEEDISNIQYIDSVLFYDKDLPEETCMRLRNWLQSLKPNKDMVEALRTEYEKGKADGIAEMKKYIDIMDKDNIDDFAYQCAYDLSKDWLYENASWDDVQIACKLGAKWYEDHHKVQWSEEDEKTLQGIIYEIQTNKSSTTSYDIPIYEEYLNWLKSLKQRHTWKPSDEQIEAFENLVRSYGESGTLSPYDNNTKLLYSLLYDLRKLRNCLWKEIK